MTIKIPTPEKMQKYPWATTSVSLFAVCIYLMYLLLTKGDYKAENERLVKENTRLQLNADALTNALLVEKGINIQQAIEKKAQDSTIREKLGTKAKQIIGGK